MRPLLDREGERVKCIFYGIPGVEFNMFLSLSSSSFFPFLHPPLFIIDEFCGRCSERESERGIHLHTNIMLNNSRMAEGGREGGQADRIVIQLAMQECPQFLTVTICPATAPAGRPDEPPDK